MLEQCIILAETGMSQLSIALIVTALIMLSFCLFIVSKKFNIKNLLMVLVLLMVAGTGLMTQSAWAQQANECVPGTNTPTSPTGPTSNLEVVDDFVTMAPGMYLRLSILVNDLFASDDPVDLATIDLNPSTPEIDTYIELYDPSNPTYACGTAMLTTYFGYLEVSLSSDCYDYDTLETIPLPSSLNFMYTAKSQSGMQAPNPATVTITIDPDFENIVIAEDDADLDSNSNTVTFNILANDSTTIGSLDPFTVDLDPNTPGRQVSTTIVMGDNAATVTVDNAGNVTVTSIDTPENYWTPEFFYTVANMNGDVSNVARVEVQLGEFIVIAENVNFQLGSDVNVADLANTTVGVIDPDSVDLDPNTPGRQTSITLPSIAEPDVDITISVDAFGVVTASAALQENYGDYPLCYSPHLLADIPYTIANMNGDVSLVAYIEVYIHGNCPV